MTQEQKQIIKEFVDAYKCNIEIANMGTSEGRDAYYDVVRHQYVNEEFGALEGLII